MKGKKIGRSQIYSHSRVALAYCKADAQRLCAGTQPGGGLVKCLKAHENEVSIGCAKELKKVKAEMGK